MCILKNPVYLGHLALLRQTTVSYKNRKIIHKPMEDWIVTENTHEPKEENKNAYDYDDIMEDIFSYIEKSER